MKVLAIDPGTEQSAWLYLVDGLPQVFAIERNRDFLHSIREGGFAEADVAVIEQVESYGMPVGREVFETVRWAGRFEEALARNQDNPIFDRRVEVMPRRRVKVAICHDTKAKDPNIRAGLIDRFGGPEAIRKGGVLFGISKDLWSALAIAVTYTEETQ